MEVLFLILAIPVVIIWFGLPIWICAKLGRVQGRDDGWRWGLWGPGWWGPLLGWIGVLILFLTLRDNRVKAAKADTPSGKRAGEQHLPGFPFDPSARFPR